MALFTVARHLCFLGQIAHAFFALLIWIYRQLLIYDFILGLVSFHSMSRSIGSFLNCHFGNGISLLKIFTNTYFISVIIYHNCIFQFPNVLHHLRLDHVPLSLNIMIYYLRLKLAFFYDYLLAYLSMPPSQ